MDGIRQFDVGSMPDGAVVLVVGPKNTGKTTVSLDLLHHKRHLAVGAVLSRFESANCTYASALPHAPKERISGRADAGVLRGLFDEQRQRVGMGPESYRSLVIDGLAHESELAKSPEMAELFANGRLMHLFTVITNQDYKEVPPTRRSQIDFLILTKLPSHNLDALYAEALCEVPGLDKAAAHELVQSCTRGFDCLVIDCCNASHVVMDHIFRYRAQRHPPPAGNAK